MVRARGPHLNTENTSTAQLSHTLQSAIEHHRVGYVRAYIFANRYNIKKLNAVGRDGLTPLMLAASSGSWEIVALFVDVLVKHHGFGLNFQDYDGMSALIHAIYRNNVAAAKILLDCPLVAAQGPVCFRIEALEYAKQQHATAIEILIEKRLQNDAAPLAQPAPQEHAATPKLS